MWIIRSLHCTRWNTDYEEAVHLAGYSVVHSPPRWVFRLARTGTRAVWRAIRVIYGRRRYEAPVLEVFDYRLHKTARTGEHGEVSSKSVWRPGISRSTRFS